MLRGPHWTLLTVTTTPLPDLPGTPATAAAPRTVHVTTDPSATATTPGTVIDTNGHAHRAYGTTGDELVLIRPDGCIATRRPTAALPSAGRNVL
ncbi:hypothetical protein HA039_15605 [Streptomyces liangshanensis]|uniref:Uncharacterized protein n=1 Tax=Streptomyces liangshanensis TaxID=2717324 RepID=A0A6G9GZ51_9ACTN|nr:hypothetical protein [Streptomyces liangshanensis]QIQ03562.1 hypothetical protein HA039_15605 [Streptomyces liangshanensis]